MNIGLSAFKSTHNLPFMTAPWEYNVCPEIYIERFKVGTCQGIYQISAESYAIIAIDNKQPGNGHLNDVFEWFENGCKRDGKSLKVLELFNERFENHLKTKRGFTGTYNLEKTFVNTK